MVNGLQRQNKRTTQEYRNIQGRESYSTLKQFVDSPLSYYKEHILGNKKKDKKSKDIITGQVVDCLITCPQEYHILFEESNCGEIDPNTTTQIGKFALKLWELVEPLLDENGMLLSTEFIAVAEEAFNKVKFSFYGEEIAFKGKQLEYCLEKFYGSKFQDWYDAQLAACTTSNKKTIIDQQMKDNADRIVETVKNSALSWIFHNSIYQQQVEFELFGLPFKSMFDILKIDEYKEEILLADIKTTWEVHSFSRNYLKNYYYIQAGCYYLALREWMKYKEIENYTVKVGFLTADSTNQHQPLLYLLEDSTIREALNGFTVNGKKYRGVKEICENLLWAKSTGIFDITREDYMNNNIRKLKII